MSLSGKLRFSSAGEDKTCCLPQNAARNPVNATDPVRNTKRNAKFVLRQMEEHGPAGLKKVNAHCSDQQKTPSVLPKCGVAEEKDWRASDVSRYTIANAEFDGNTLLKSDQNDAKHLPKVHQTTAHSKPSLNQAVQAMLHVDPATIGPSVGYTATLKNMLDVALCQKRKVEHKKAVDEEEEYDMMEMKEIDEEEDYETVEMNEAEKDEAEMAEWEEIRALG